LFNLKPELGLLSEKDRSLMHIEASRLPPQLTFGRGLARHPGTFQQPRFATLLS